MDSTQTVYLKLGDKVRDIQSGEAGEIIQIVDEHHAIVDFFDGPSERTSRQIIPFNPNRQLASTNESGSILFNTDKETQKKQSSNPVETYQSLNERKNQFPYELDLHADQLFGDTSTRNPNELLPLQLNRLRQYLDKAIDLRIQRVYIIHGVGSGRLKSEVHTILSQNPKVKSYSNEYNPKYGMGATEVRLQ